MYDEEANKMYFHGCKVGHKTESIKRNDKACFSVYRNETIKEERWAPYLESVVVFGRYRVIEYIDNVALRMFENKYYSNSEPEEEVSKSGNAVEMFEICIEHLDGKMIQEK